MCTVSILVSAQSCLQWCVHNHVDSGVCIYIIMCTVVCIHT
jgi:hypothetical protein